eukprot:PhF_6_TR27932/c0_g1_i5/m.41130
MRLLLSSYHRMIEGSRSLGYRTNGTVRVPLTDDDIMKMKNKTRMKIMAREFHCLRTVGPSNKIQQHHVKKKKMPEIFYQGTTLSENRKQLKTEEKKRKFRKKKIGFAKLNKKFKNEVRTGIPIMNSTMTTSMIGSQ